MWQSVHFILDSPHAAKKKPHGCHRLAVRGLLCQGGGTRPVKSLASSVIHKLRNNGTFCLTCFPGRRLYDATCWFWWFNRVLRFVQLGPHPHRDRAPQKCSNFPKMDSDVLVVTLCHLTEVQTWISMQLKMPSPTGLRWCRIQATCVIATLCYVELSARNWFAFWQDLLLSSIVVCRSFKDTINNLQFHHMILLRLFKRWNALLTRI